jgi:anti-sigma regulatory factor (Ser/Thr protein kinase)
VARLLRVGEVARELGVSPSRLRHLADAGAVPSERSAGGHRLFDPGAVRSALAGLSPWAELSAARWESPTWEREVDLVDLHEDVVWQEIEREVLDRRLGDAARSTAVYAFTEMLNNAIDHSGAPTARVAVWMTSADVRFEVRDSGRGALPNLRERLGLEDIYDALGELAKGRVTTDPARHTGEGIFFTSKAVDVFVLESAGIRWTVDNIRQDQAVGHSDVVRGTRVRWELDPRSKRRIADVFDQYTDENHDFSRTRTVVRLFGIGSRFISRSEAKRLMRGLERFSHVTLDFAGVEDAGQGFVDEVFRVWPSQHPGTEVVPVGATGPVDFMIRRGLPSADRPVPQESPPGHPPPR